MRRLVLVLVFVAIACGTRLADQPPASTAIHLASLTSQARTAAPTPGGSRIPEVTSGTATVEVGDQFFLPEQLRVTVGTTVTWINRGQLYHTATARDRSFSSPNLEFGRTFSFTFTKPGRYPYFCALHGDMIGEVDVIGGG